MTTLKSCSIDDQYKHVSFKDLEGYLRKDDYLSGYCEAEKELVRQNLGIEVYKVDSKLSDLSTNPVENKVIAKALKNKADIDKLPKVAITGNYCDLHNKPHYLPNPEFLVIVDSNGTVGYNGEAPVKVKLPTHMSELTNDVGYLTEETLAVNYVKGIKPNEGEDILWPEDGIITLDINKLTGIDHELSITSTRPVENKVITRALKHIQNNVAKKLNDLEDVIDAEHPENGQILSYVKEDGCEGYWKPVEIPRAGDVLEFDGTSWKPVNLNQKIVELIESDSCLWKVSDDHKLVPNNEAIRAIDSEFAGDISTEGSIYSGIN
jgi:hypothetical protein